MALVNLETYYLFPNLSDENNVFRYSPGFVEVSRRGDEDDSTRQRQWVEVQIPEGSYDLIDIAETIKIVIKQNGHNDESIKITANTNTLKSVLEIKGDFQVDFRARNSISSVLRFQNQVYEEGIYESDSVVNILSDLINKFNSRECGCDWLVLCEWENAKHNLQFLSKCFTWI